MDINNEARGIDFKQYSLSDSAMTYSLSAKEILGKISDTETLVNVLLTIADLHYIH